MCKIQNGHASTNGGQKKTSDPLKLEIQMGASMWLLESELRNSVRTEIALNH